MPLKLPLTMKPAEPTSIINALIGPLIAGDTLIGDHQLTWASPATILDPDSAPRGPSNRSYVENPPLIDLDPTSTLALGLQSAERNRVSGTTGYTHLHRAVEYLSAISAQFASWYREYLILYNQ